MIDNLVSKNTLTQADDFGKFTGIMLNAFKPENDFLRELIMGYLKTYSHEVIEFFENYSHERYAEAIKNIPPEKLDTVTTQITGEKPKCVLLKVASNFFNFFRSRFNIKVS